jgi:hypothetical protein
MNAPAVTVVELTDDELRLVNNALHMFLNAFGHDEADVVQAVQRVLGKLSAASRTPPVVG